MEPTGFYFFLFCVAFIVTTMVYPFVVAFAKLYNVVDNPDARKLQLVPIPVMGGATIFVGLAISILIAYFMLGDIRMIKVLVFLLIMYVMGLWDDVKDLPAAFKFIMEVGISWAIIIVLGVEINDFHGLFGINHVNDVIAVPLSLIAGVGIMNAVNMIDGVDGYCSSYGAIACGTFALIFHHCGDTAMFILALIETGALIPFFFHNVSGKTSKMFLGDGGSLTLGMLLALFTFSTLSTKTACSTAFDNSSLSPVALSLAILAIPVFDTLKVMSYRMVKGIPPFHPDKTHLHHLFIDMHFSHLATSGIIVIYNFLIVVLMLLCWSLGASAEVQLCVVLLFAFLMCAFYFFMAWERRRYKGEGSARFQRWCRYGDKTHISGSTLWKLVCAIVDCRLLGGAWIITYWQHHINNL
jgi:UDP-N-acetylmuramyl pentapeptide phosphotransferase/UDP-N-acetylglucosamine-1-phosphate transferase